MNQINDISTRRTLHGSHFGTFSGALIKSSPSPSLKNYGVALHGLRQPAKESSLTLQLGRFFLRLVLGSFNSSAVPATRFSPPTPRSHQTRLTSDANSAVAGIPDWLISQPSRIEGSTTVSWSHYNQPIDSTVSESASTFFGNSGLGNSELAASELHGTSRRWGDAAKTTQAAVINEIVFQATVRGWRTKQVAFALALARVESGFNPDAAAQSTSATGVGQIIDRTAESLGLGQSERFSISENVLAMLSLIDQNRKLAQRLTSAGLETPAGLALQYGLYHDGPDLKYGGEKIARESVLPWVERIYQWLTKPPIAVPN